MSFLPAWLHAARLLLFPPEVTCKSCKAPLDRQAVFGLCPACTGELCALARRDNPFAAPYESLDYALCAYTFDGAVRKLIHHLKYAGELHIAPLLAKAMAPLVPAQVDYLVPIPLHPRRERFRGFNQARALGEEMHALGAPPCVDALQRVRMTQQQAVLHADKRQSNLRGSMRAAQDVRGKHILLVDDVFTTGATACEAARVLKHAGALRVGIVVVART